MAEVHRISVKLSVSQRKVVKYSLDVKVVSDLPPDSGTGLELRPLSESIQVSSEA
jgi:hypothetical protein